MNCSYDEYGPVDIDKILIPSASYKQENIDDYSSTHYTNIDKKSVESQECVGRVSNKNNTARKTTFAETVANYVAPRVAPRVAIAPHV